MMLEALTIIKTHYLGADNDGSHNDEENSGCQKQKWYTPWSILVPIVQMCFNGVP